MERNVMGELNMYRQAGAKPNFSEVTRRHGMDRKTVAKYRRLGEAPADRPPRPSGFDAVREVIEEKAGLPGVTERAVHECLLHRHAGAGLPGCNAFTAYCRSRGIEFGAARDPEAHPRFETPPGRQLQFDWKEDVRMVDADGEVFEFNVFTATLGYSRLHKSTYSPTRTTDDLLACLPGAFRFTGGVPQECLTESPPFPLTLVLPFRHDAPNGERRERWGTRHPSTPPSSSSGRRGFTASAGARTRMCLIASKLRV